MGQFFARQRAARVPHSTLSAAASSGKARRKPRIASEVLLDRPYVRKTAFPPDHVSIQPGIAKTVRALAFSSIFFRQGCSQQLRPAQKLRVLSSQAATATTPQALSAMNAMSQSYLVARFIICTRRSNGKRRTRKMPTRRGLLLLLAVEGRSERCGAYATAKPKRTVSLSKTYISPILANE